MNNHKVYQVLSVLGFLVSAIFTVKLFASNSTDIVSWVAMVSTAILYEFGKYTLLYQAIKGPWGSTGKTIMICSWAFVTIASIVASATYVLNDANANKNIELESSSAYVRQQDGLTINKDLYSTTKKEIDDLKNLQAQVSQKGEEIKNSMPKNYIDRRQQQQDKTIKDVSTIQDQINTKSTELSNIAKGISSPSNIIMQEESTTGGTSMFKLIAAKLNENPKNKKNPYSQEEVGIFFYIAIGMGLELLANLFAFLAQYYANTKVSTSPISPEKKNKPVIETISSNENNKSREIQGGRLQGMKFKVKDNISMFRPRPREVEPLAKTRVAENDIEKYLQFVKENQGKNGNAPGRTKISSGTGIPQETCRMIHNILLDRGVLIAGDKCTIIAKIGEVV